MPTVDEFAKKLFDAKEVGEAERVAAARTTIILEDSPARVTSMPVPAAANAGHFTLEEEGLIRERAANFQRFTEDFRQNIRGSGGLTVDNVEASNALERAKALGEIERSAPAARDPLLKAHLEGVRTAITEDPLLHASEVGKANLAAAEANSPAGRLTAAREAGAAERAALAAETPEGRILAAQEAGIQERAATRATAAQEISANDRLQVARDAGVAERNAAAAEVQARLDAIHAEPQARIEAAHKASQAERVAADKALKAAHAESPQGRIEAAHEAGQAERVAADKALKAAHAQSPQAKIEVAHAQDAAAHRVSAQREALEKLTPDERLKIAHDQGVKAAAEKYAESPTGRLEAAQKAGAAERAVPPVPAAKTVEQLTQEAVAGAKQEVVAKAAAEAVKDTAGQAAKTTATQAATQAAVASAGESTLAKAAGFLARNASGVGGVVTGAFDVIPGIMNHDEVRVTRGGIKGGAAALGTAAGAAIAAATLPVTAPVLATVAVVGATAAAAVFVADKAVDAMTSKGGLTDRGGRPVASSGVNMHGGKVVAAPVVEKGKEPEAHTGLTDRSGKPIASSGVNMHGGKVATVAPAVAAPVVTHPSVAAPVPAAPVQGDTSHKGESHPVPHKTAAKPKAAPDDPSSAIREQMKADIAARLKADPHAANAEWNAGVIKLEQELVNKKDLSVDDIRKAFKETNFSMQNVETHSPQHAPSIQADIAVARK